MINLSTATSWIIIVMSPLTAAAYASSETSCIIAILLFSLGGLAFGFAMAMANLALGNRLLNMKSAICFPLYLLLPVASLATTIGAVIGIGFLIF